MCGIAGWIDWNFDLTTKRDILEKMLEPLSCRGPDAEGIWVSPTASLAHRRLIVIDPEGGGQPMTCQYGENTYAIVYNGELYNTPELRKDLIVRGHSFRSRSDTEVLLKSFVEWGESCVEHLNGIFAFAIWDDAQQSLFLARDRLGVKPLFYSRQDHGLLFASEIKGLIQHPMISTEVDSEGLNEVFAIGPARTPGCGVFRGINELKPGFSATFDHNGLRPRQYWSLKSYPHTDDIETTVYKIKELFYDAVSRQLVSDFPVCTLLSGGLDSSGITAVAVLALEEASKGPVDTYSIDYKENERHFTRSDFQPDPDTPWAKRVSQFLGTRHHMILLDTPDLVNSLPAAMYARDLPGMADVDSSLLLFSRKIKKDARVAVSGECADEIFGGYPWFHWDITDSTTFPWAPRLKERLSILSPELLSYTKPKAYVEARYREALNEVPRLPGEDPSDARAREITYLTLTRWMPTLLDRKDRMSMAAGLEIRVPFCDHRLVEYAWNIPWKMKCWDKREKGLLRRALSGILPKDVIARKKSPYPKTHNPDYLAATRGQLEQILDDPTSPLLPLINSTVLKEFIRSEKDLDVPWFGQLMKAPQLFAYLLQMDLWLREYQISLA